jgi:deoxyhypusine synthase
VTFKEAITTYLLTAHQEIPILTGNTVKIIEASQMATTAKMGKKKAPILSPATKTGSYGEYLWNHPEEVERILREHDVDIEKLNKILEGGGGVIHLNFDKKNRSRKKNT